MEGDVLNSSHLSTREIPQADTLENITDAVDFVSKGHCTYQSIAKKLGLTERQGRYYRLAAELLGFIRNVPHRNASRLTPLGQRFLQSGNDERRQILFDQIFAVPAIQTVIGILASSNGSALQEEISNLLLEVVTDSTQTMMKRRLQTILSWLGTLGIITKSGSVIKLGNLPDSAAKIEIKDLNMPVLPRVDDTRHLKNVSAIIMSCKNVINQLIEAVKTEREDAIHEKLRSMLARRIRMFGAVPTFNSYVDLAIRIDDTAFIVEAKVLGTNIESQIQNGLSQLENYRRLQCMPDAKLVLLIDKPLSEEYAEPSSYPEKEKGVYLIWNGLDDNLFTTEKGIEDLPFMRTKQS